MPFLNVYLAESDVHYMQISGNIALILPILMPAAASTRGTSLAFFSRAYTTKPEGKGSSMGLDLVRKIVGEMDGSISVESEVSKGTNLRIVFPLYQ